MESEQESREGMTEGCEVRVLINPPGPAGHLTLARGTFRYSYLGSSRSKTQPPLLKGGAAAAAEGLQRGLVLVFVFV